MKQERNRLKQSHPSLFILFLSGYPSHSPQQRKAPWVVVIDSFLWKEGRDREGKRDRDRQRGRERENKENKRKKMTGWSAAQCKGSIPVQERQTSSAPSSAPAQEPAGQVPYPACPWPCARRVCRESRSSGPSPARPVPVGGDPDSLAQGTKAVCLGCRQRGLCVSVPSRPRPARAKCPQEAALHPLRAGCALCPRLNAGCPTRPSLARALGKSHWVGATWERP